MLKDLSKIRKRRNRGGTKRKILKRGLVFLLIFLGLVFGIGYPLVYRPAKKVMSAAKELQAHEKPLKDAILLQDLVKAEEELNAIEADLEAVRARSRKLSWLKIVPFARAYYLDSQHILNSARHGINAAKKSLDAITPVASALGLKTAESQEVPELSMEDRISATVQVMPILADNLENLEGDLKAIEEEMGSVDPGRYPSFLYLEGQNVQELLTTVRSYTDNLSTSLPKVQETLRTLPSVFGFPTARRYVVIFQNDKELRPTGGFWTAYAIATLDRGKMINLRSGDMYFVDYRIAPENKTPAPAVYKQLLKVDNWYIRDSNLSPDFAAAVGRFERFWNQAQAGGTRQARLLDQSKGALPDFDGVIALDTEVVKAFLEVLGEVEVDGKEFNGDNVILELEKQATIIKKEQEGRKALIGNLMDALFEKAFTTPKNKWDDLIAVILQAANGKHILLNFQDAEEQRWAENLNWAGRIKDYEGDYFHLNEANFGGAKANLYVTRTVKQVVKKEGGSWVKTVTVDFRNPEPHDGWLNGPYRSYIRVLAPKGSELISVEGGQLEVPQKSYFDDIIGKQVFAAFNITKPEDSSQLVFKYKLPDSVVRDGVYRLLVQKQPGLNGPEYTVTVRGKSKQFTLNTDEELRF